MKSATEYLWFNTEKHREFINITDKVEGLVDRSGIAEGFALVSAMHITAGVYVNDAESGLIAVYIVSENGTIQAIKLTDT